MITDAKLDFWFSNNRNVLFIGKHGVGKTAQIKSCFERNGLQLGKTFLYFSASTLDPWVDLVGIPKEVSIDGLTYLDLVRPKALASGEVEAIFFDEFNRSPKKVRNAVMELLQFRSINGLAFPNLKCVWAAINPEDDDVYDVEKIDPAQKDRFHIIKEIEYAPSMNWFISKYGKETATSAVDWWNDLPEDEKNKISPRRLEYALDEFLIGGTLQDILPISCNINKLMQTLRNGPVELKLKTLFDNKDNSASKTFLANDNNYFSAVKYILNNDEYIQYFVPFFPKEKLVALMSENDVVCRFVSSNSSTNKDFWNLLREIVMSGSDEKLVKKFRRFVSVKDEFLVKDTIPGTPDKPFYNKDIAEPKNYAYITELTLSSIEDKANIYRSLKSTISKNINYDDAKNIIYGLAHITKDIWPSSMLSPQFDDIVGIINHCLQTMADNSEEKNILDCLINESKNIGSMFLKLQLADLFKRVLRV